MSRNIAIVVAGVLVALAVITVGWMQHQDAERADMRAAWSNVPMNQ